MPFYTTVNKQPDSLGAKFVMLRPATILFVGSASVNFQLLPFPRLCAAQVIRAEQRASGLTCLLFLRLSSVESRRKHKRCFSTVLLPLLRGVDLHPHWDCVWGGEGERKCDSTSTGETGHPSSWHVWPLRRAHEPADSLRRRSNNTRGKSEDKRTRPTKESRCH